MKDFEKINWFQVFERFNPYLCSNAFIFFKETCPLYFHHIYFYIYFYFFISIYRQSGRNQANTRSSVLDLNHPLRNTCFSQNKCVVSDTNALGKFADGPEVGEFT